MKATVIVKLKDGVLDPQGETIRRALSKLGHPVRSVRQGKYFELEIEGDSAESARLEEISRDILSNPIIEDFYIRDGDFRTGNGNESQPIQRRARNGANKTSTKQPGK